MYWWTLHSIDFINHQYYTLLYNPIKPLKNHQNTVKAKIFVEDLLFSLAVFINKIKFMTNISLKYLKVQN